MARNPIQLGSGLLAALRESLAARWPVLDSNGMETGVNVQPGDALVDVEDGAFNGKLVVVSLGDVVIRPAARNGSDSTIPVSVPVQLTIFDRLREDPDAIQDSWDFVSDVISWGDKNHLVNGKPMEFVQAGFLGSVGSTDPVVKFGVEFKVDCALGTNEWRLPPGQREDIIITLGQYGGPFPPNEVVHDVHDGSEFVERWPSDP